MSDPLKRAKRLPLLALNQSTQPPPKKTYDSSLKRHTSLLNKLRKSFSLEAKESILKEIDGLSLEKYAEEIVDACVEGVGGLGGKGDVGSVVEVRFLSFDGWIHFLSAYPTNIILSFFLACFIYRS